MLREDQKMVALMEQLQIMIEDLINQIESWYPGINRELLLKIASNNV